jgi:hypothetical protein
MERNRREQVVLGVLAAVLLVLGYRAWQSTAVAPSSASNRSVAVRRGRGSAARLQAPDVHLPALDADVPPPANGGRDLFQFGARPAAPSTAGPSVPMARPAPPSIAAPSAVNTVPPIGLKFIGLVEAPESNARIAILSDGRGAPMYGREGDTIAGRYRILHIGTESVEMAYLDGRGRQTIRLTGS